MNAIDCPSFGTHRLYLQGKTYTDFVKADWENEEGRTMYVRNEYAILSCQCGLVTRVLVKDHE